MERRQRDEEHRIVLEQEERLQQTMATWNRKRFEVEDNDGDNNGANEKKEKRKEKRKRKKEKKSRPQYSDEEDAQVEEEVEDVRPETPEDDAQDALAAAFGDSDEEAVPEPRLKKARRRQALSDSDEEGQMSPHRSPPSDVEPVAEVRRRHSPSRSRLRERQLSESESE
jgi:hypothetical protein